MPAEPAPTIPWRRRKPKLAATVGADEKGLGVTGRQAASGLFGGVLCPAI
jgi:hypothetical protein